MGFESRFRRASATAAVASSVTTPPARAGVDSSPPMLLAPRLRSGVRHARAETKGVRSGGDVALTLESKLEVESRKVWGVGVYLL